MRKRKKLIKLLGIGIGSLLFLAIVFNIFKVKTISCHTQFGVCSQEVTDQFAGFLGRSLLVKLPQNEANKNVANNIQIKSAELSRKLPSTLDVAVQLRTPIGAVQGESSPDAYGLVDEDGKVITTVHETTVSVLRIKEWQPSITQLAPVHVASLKILATISQLNSTRINGEVTELGLVVNSNGVIIILDPKVPASDWYSSLQVIIDRSKIQNKLPRKIDLRFNQPVLEY